MTDLAWTGLWLAILGGGVGAAMIVRALGLPTIYVRDLLHVGAGVWVLGWTAWNGVLAPVAIVAAAVVGLALVPALASRIRLVARFEHAVSNGDETWRGLVLYGYAFLLLTAIGLVTDPFPAAAGLLALSLGDGIGGAVGRAFGGHTYATPWGKRKSLEGSIAVGLAAAAGVQLAAYLFDADPGAAAIAALGALAAVVEAIAPRSGDNLLVPTAVWAAATLI
jgi:phytol kinase